MAGNFRQVTKSVWLVGCGGWGGQKEKFSRPSDSNVYLVDGGRELALVDAGLGPENHQILANIRAAGFNPKKIRKIFLTHCHGDHSEAAAWLRDMTGARIYAGPVTARALEEGERNLLGGMEPFVPFTPVTYRVDRVLADGEETTVGNLVQKTIYTTGHSIDSICFVSEIGGRKVLFSGDTFIGRQTRPDRDNHTYPCVLGWLDGHWSDGLTRYVASLRKLQQLTADLALPGHGVPQNRKTAEIALKAGIKSLQRVLDDEDLFHMFSVSR